MTLDDLKALGLELNPQTGKYQKRPKVKRKTESFDEETVEFELKRDNVDFDVFGVPTYDILIKDLPRYFMSGFPGKKTEKVYATAQAFYSGLHHVIRSDIKRQAKALLRSYVAEKIGTALPAGSLIAYIFSDKRKISAKMNIDIDNRGYFWDKMFCDLLEDVSLVPRDNVFFLPTKIYHFNDSVKANRLRILIYTP